MHIRKILKPTFSAITVALFLSVVTTPTAASKRLLLPFQKNTVNVSISFNTQVPLTDANQETLAEIQRSGRKLFYQMTLQECETLLEVIANSCVLKSLNVSSRIQNPNNGSKLIYLNGSARFIITLK